MLTTVNLVKRELRQIKGTTNMIDNNQQVDEQAILDAIDTVVGNLETDTLVGRVFVPEIETRYWDAIPMEWNGLIDGQTLHLDDDLISLTSLVNTDGDVSTTITVSERTLLPRGDSVTNRIKLVTGGAVWPIGAVDPEDAIAITGTWGWHPRPSQRWKDSLDANTGALGANGTVVAVTDADGVSWHGFTPRFSEGQLLQIDSEMLQVRSIVGNNLDVLRGVRGSTEVTHDAGTQINVFNPTEAAERYATRAAMLDYQRRGEFLTKKVEGITEITYPTPQTMPEYINLLKLRRVAKPVMG